MKEKLISYSTAILAKKAGFWLTSSDWRESMTFYAGPGKDGEGWLIESALGNDCDFESEQCYAPTQSLLNTWLRNVYNYHFCSEPYGKGFKSIAYRMWKPDRGPSEIGGVENTYEEALENALAKALETIILNNLN